MDARHPPHVLAAATAGVAVADASVSVAAIRPLRLRLMPALSGLGAPDRVALTFDDGPHPVATPHMLRTLAEMGAHATFFVLTGQVERYPELAARVVAEGHEIALHGYRHRPHLLRTPVAVAADLTRARRDVRRLTGTTPRFWRPPHGIPTGTGLLAARRLGMRPVLWTAEAREWRRRATPESALALLRSQVGGGGVILLHDSDCASTPGSWRTAEAILPALIEWCRAHGWQVGPLRDHGLQGQIVDMGPRRRGGERRCA